MANDGVRYVETSAKVGVGEGGNVFDDGSTVDHGVMFEGSATGNHGRGTNAGTGSDEGRTEHTGATMNLSTASDPDAGLDLVTFRLDLRTLHERVDGEVAQVVRRGQTVDVSIIRIELAAGAKLAKMMTEEESSVIPARTGDGIDVERMTGLIHDTSDVGTALEVVLKQVRVIELGVGTEANQQDQFGTGFRGVGEGLFHGAPELIGRGTNPGAVSCGSERPAIRRHIGDDRDGGDVVGLQVFDHAKHDWLAQDVSGGNGRGGHDCGLLAEIKGGVPKNNDCSYIHGAHLGAAARKIADREGIQAGRRRKREIGSNALAL